MKTISGSVLLASLSSIALASKDSTVYPKGFTNPNVDNAMYWADSKNVLEDLSQFDKLYVQYHGCAWSPYFKTADDDNGGENICSGYEGGTSDGGTGWYLGMAGCNRAQVAYSLYGTLKGKKDKGCRKSQFINSFFTFGGVEAWISSMQSFGTLQDFSTSNGDEDEDRRLDYDEYTIATTCTTLGGDEDRKLEEDNGDEDDGEGDDGEGDDGEGDDGQEDDGEEDNGGSGDGDGNGNSFNEGATSIGVGCTTAGNFRLYEFQGSYCHADNSSQIVASLSAFNSAIEEQTCVEIYDSSTYTTYSGAEDGEEDEDEEAASPLTVLAQSKSCSPQWSSNCPDPYGKVTQYETVMARAQLSETDTAALEKRENLFHKGTIFFFSAGSIVLLLAYFIKNRTKQKKQKHSVTKDDVSVDSASTTGTDENDDTESWQRHPTGHDKHMSDSRSRALSRDRSRSASRTRRKRSRPQAPKRKNSGSKGFFSKLFKW
jgi:hypothetical protein